MESIESLFYTEVHESISKIPAIEWNHLITDPDASPFIRHEYLEAMETSESVSVKSGWQPCHFAVRSRQNGELLCAMPAYLKKHSYGEYVFDWAWANAYQQNGLQYYPKLLSAIPFTPVGGSRIIGGHREAQEILIASTLEWIKEQNISSMHMLFPLKETEELLKKFDFLRRESIQFHWQNQSLERPSEKLQDFNEFLYTLNKKRRNNILRERQSVQDVGVSFEHRPGSTLDSEDWDDFYTFYTSNYINHGNAPYLTRSFFELIGKSMGEYIHIIFAIKDHHRIACSLLFRNRQNMERAYGRYWGSTEYVSNLHFETAYYQSIEFCISQKISVFEGGAQGEHKIHRGLLPVNLYSMHYLVDDRFASAIEDFLQREGNSMHRYLNELVEHQPLKKAN